MKDLSIKMRDLEITVNGKAYLKMLQISNKSGDFQMASPKDPGDFEPKFFRISEAEEVMQYEEVDEDTLKKLKDVYCSKRKENN